MKKGFIHKKYAAQKRFNEVEGFGFGAGILGPPVMTAWCYYYDGILIDTGTGLLRREAVDMIEKFNPSMILLTHHHEDHSGNAAAISRKKGIPVFGHPYAISNMSRKNKIMPYQHLMWGASEPVEVLPFPDCIESKNLKLTPLHTPGHSKDHTVFIEKNRGWVFSGDLFLGTKIKFFRKDEILSDQITSIKKLLSYDFDTLYCAHNPQMSGGKKALGEKLDFLENLFGTILNMSEKGLSERAIIKELDQGRDRFIKIITCWNVSFANMVRSALKPGRE